MGSAQSGTMPTIVPQLQQTESNVKEPAEYNKDKSIPVRTLKSMLSILPQKPALNMPDLHEFQKMLNESDSDINKFFQLVSGRISDLYINLSKQTLQLMCDKKLTTQEGKIAIAQQVLYMSMNILKTLGLKSDYAFDSQIISKLNSLQLSMLGYMKAKYPRQSQNFVPGELMQQFKNIDFVEQPENDVLRSLRIYFGNEDQGKLMYQVKAFINRLIEELDAKFPVFEELLSSKVFVVTKQGKQYSVFNKIGRKIPQNVDKFSLQDESNIDLKSPEIFRVIVKWVSDMQDYILHSQDEVKQKDHFKIVSVDGNNIKFDHVSTDEMDSYLSSLQSQLSTYQQEYNNELDTLKTYVELFNHNLIRILTKTQRIQKYVPRKQTQIIKYAMFNKRLLSWMMIQKLMIVLKKLIKTSKSLQQTIGMRLDLIKFNVTDLMRAMMVGNKFEIIKVFNNLKALQSANVIKIFKIKNRLETPLNDAMIIFKMTDSFIICELQLILSDSNHSANQKLKNIETLNHFFYELQRSPYGVMAELAALLSFTDNKTNYESSIKFQWISQYNLQTCQQQHSQRVLRHQIQKHPFICSQCTQFYAEYTNQYIYKHCEKCNLFLCAKCIFKSNKEASEEVSRTDAINNKILQVINQLSLTQQDYVKKVYSQNQQSAVYANNIYHFNRIKAIIKPEKSKPLREIAQNKKYITFKELENVVNIKQQVYFIIGKFIAGKLRLISMKFDHINGINYSFTLNRQATDKRIDFGYYDFIIVLSQQEGERPFNERQSVLSTVQLFKNYQRPDRSKITDSKQEKCQVIYISNDMEIQICKIFLVLDINIKDKNQKNAQYINKKQFKYDSIEDLRKSLPNLLQTHQAINLTNEGIELKHLDYFKNIQWKDKVKYINLTNNKLVSIQPVLEELPNLQKLIVTKNQIQQIQFKKKLPHFKKLVALENVIEKFTGIENIQNVETLNFQINSLSQFPFNTCALPQLRYLDLSYNQLQSLSSLSSTNYPKLTSLQVNGDGNYQRQKCPCHIDLPSLKIFTIKNLSFQCLWIINSTCLESIDMEQIESQQFFLENKTKLKKIFLYKCNFHFNPEYYQQQRWLYQQQQQPQQLQKQQKQQLKQKQKEKQQFNTDFMINFWSKQYENLQDCDINSCWQITQLPILQMPNLNRLSICCDGKMSNFQNLAVSKLNNLQYLHIKEMTIINQLPLLNLPKLKQLIIQSQKILNATELQNWVLPSLQILQLGNLDTSQIPMFQNINAKSFTITGGKLRQKFQLNNKNIQILTFREVECSHLISINIPNAIDIVLENCTDFKLSLIQTIKMNRIKIIQATNLRLKQQMLYVPVFDSLTLQNISLVKCGLEDVSNLALSSLPNLKVLNLEGNNFYKMPALNFPLLSKLDISQTGIVNLTEFSNSILPKLQNLKCDNNTIKEIPVLRMPQLKTLKFVNSCVELANNLSLCQLPLLYDLGLSGPKNNIQTFPILNLPNLTDIDLNYRNLKYINNFTKSTLDKLKILNFVNLILDVPILPKLKLNSLTCLKIQNSNISDISNLTESQLPLLDELIIKKSKIKILPVLKFQELTKINCNNDSNYKLNPDNTCIENIDALSDSDLPALTQLQFDQNRIIKIPKMEFMKLKRIYITNNNITDVTEFKNSKLPQFETLNIYNNKITGLPVGKNIRPTFLFMFDAAAQNFNELTQYAPEFQSFYYNNGVVPAWPENARFRRVKIFQLMQCGLTNIDNIVHYPFDQLRQLAFTDNKIVKFPRLLCPKLQKLHGNKNCIQDISQFVLSDLPDAIMVSFQFNVIQNLTDFPFINCKQIFFSHNKFTDISFTSKYIYTGVVMLVLYDCKIQKLGKINAPILDKLYMNQNCIKSLQGMRNSSMPSCSLIQFSNNQIQDLQPLNAMGLDALDQLYMMKNKVKKLCQLNLPKLYILNLSDNPIAEVGEFQKSTLNLSSFTYSLAGTYEQHKDKYEKLQSIFGASTYYSPYDQNQPVPQPQPQPEQQQEEGQQAEGQQDEGDEQQDQN